jgi:hypothetical protein
MASAISSVTQTQPPPPPTKAPSHKAAQPEAKSGGGTDTVQLSATAKAALAALQEASETAAQTATEAGNGDLQAQRLLAKQTAAKPVTK